MKKIALGLALLAGSAQAAEPTIAEVFEHMNVPCIAAIASQKAGLSGTDEEVLAVFKAVGAGDLEKSQMVLAEALVNVLRYTTEEERLVIYPVLVNNCIRSMGASVEAVKKTVYFCFSFLRTRQALAALLMAAVPVPAPGLGTGHAAHRRRGETSRLGPPANTGRRRHQPRRHLRRRHRSPALGELSR